MRACRDACLRHQPNARTLEPQEFWPPLLLAELRATPDVNRCIAALIVMAWQSAAVERDLAIVAEVDRRADGQLGMTRLPNRCRAAIEGPTPDE